MNCDNCDKPLESGRYSLFQVRQLHGPDAEWRRVHPECKEEFAARMTGEGAEVELVENVDDSRNAEWSPEFGRPQRGR